MDDSIVRSAREAAFKEAISKEAGVPKLEERNVRSLEEIKSKVKEGRKEQMRKREYYLCDSCDAPIHNPDLGFIVHGNIYVADPSCRGGLIGNNFPDVAVGEKIEVTDVKESVYCRKCFAQAVSICLTTATQISLQDKLKDAANKHKPPTKKYLKPIPAKQAVTYAPDEDESYPEETITDEAFISQLRDTEIPF
jgi:hypothetical protein